MDREQFEHKGQEHFDISDTPVSQKNTSHMGENAKVPKLPSLKEPEVFLMCTNSNHLLREHQSQSRPINFFMH